MLKELKQVHCFEPEKRKALTVAEQELFLSYLTTTMDIYTDVTQEMRDDALEVFEKYIRV